MTDTRTEAIKVLAEALPCSGDAQAAVDALAAAGLLVVQEGREAAEHYRQEGRDQEKVRHEPDPAALREFLSNAERRFGPQPGEPDDPKDLLLRAAWAERDQLREQLRLARGGQHG